MLEFVSNSDGQTLKDLSRSTRKFAEHALVVKRGEEPSFNREIFNEMAKIGLTGAPLEESSGGAELGPLDIAAVLFELSRLQLGPAIYLSVHYMAARLVERWGNRNVFAAELRKMACGDKLAAFCLTETVAGSDSAALVTRAEKRGDRYILNGEKIYITSAGEADLYLVFARTSEDRKRGISAFLVGKAAPGISFGRPEKKMGCSGSPIASVTFQDCEIPTSALVGDEGQGHKIALSGLSGGRINIAACACAIAARAMELASAHVVNRKQFQQRIADFQGVQFIFADMVMGLRASILLTREAAKLLGEGDTRGSASSIAKCFATDQAMAITTNCVQMLGGAGYLADYEVERLMRDAKMLQIVEGTNQIQRAIIAREFFEAF